MEEVIARFPHLAEYIFNSLSNKTLADCRKVNKAWKGFIDSERFYKKFYKKRIGRWKKKTTECIYTKFTKTITAPSRGKT